MIRKARVEDMPKIIALGKRLQARTVYADIPIDIQTFGGTLGQCISSAFGFAMVAEREGEITGLMLGAAMPLWFSKKRSATDFITYSERAGDGYRMIRKFIDWAWSLSNVVEITLAQSSGVDTERSEIIYQRLGLSRVGAIYMVAREPEATEEAA